MASEPTSTSDSTISPHGDDKRKGDKPSDDMHTYVRKKANQATLTNFNSKFRSCVCFNYEIRPEQKYRLIYTYPQTFSSSAFYHSPINVTCVVYEAHTGEKEIDDELFIKLDPRSYVPPETVRDVMLDKRYDKELAFYNHVLPVLRDFYARMTVQESDNIRKHMGMFPRFIGYRKEELECRDNPPDADYMIIRYQPILVTGPTVLDVDWAMTIIDRLAEFHSMSVVMRLHDPKLYDACVQKYVHQTDILRQWYSSDSSINYIFKRLREIPQLIMCRDKVKEVLKWSATYIANEPVNKHWLGLCHGRFALMNIMYGKPDVEHKDPFVLFDNMEFVQTRHILSDLAFFLLTSLPLHTLTENEVLSIINRYRLHLMYVILKYKHVDKAKLEHMTKLLEDELGFSKEIRYIMRKELVKAIHFVRFQAPITSEQSEHMVQLSAWITAEPGTESQRFNEPLYLEKLKNCIQGADNWGLFREADWEPQRVNEEVKAGQGSIFKQIYRSVRKSFSKSPEKEDKSSRKTSTEMEVDDDARKGSDVKAKRASDPQASTSKK